MSRFHSVLGPSVLVPSVLARSVLAGLLFALAVLVLAPPARADPVEDEQGHRARSIAENVMSPFCPGMTLAACTSPAAREWRADIREWVHQGMGDQEIRQRLEQRAGQDLSGTPNSSLGWFAPLGITVISAGLLVWLLRRWLRRTPEPKSLELDKAVDARLEAELDRALRDDAP